MRYYWPFCRQRKLLDGSENVVKASVGSTEENLSWNKRYSSMRRKRWSTRSLLKEILNFVFNKSAQETKRTGLSRLILHKKEIPRRRINPKNWHQNELSYKIPKNGILWLIKVKPTIGGWWHGFKHASRRISLYPSYSFIFVRILSLLEFMLFLLPYSNFFRQA